MWLVGYAAKAALRQPTLWVMVAAFAVLGLGVAAFLGIGLVPGRIVAGVLLLLRLGPYPKLPE
ncbi:MAG: hypothetical protein O9284_01845 [Steroidobacteraceae bacterium]|nr:hypothetical protein [Steroidobacteraceae bacterium]